LWFEASRFERLGRQIAAAPRAVVVALAALTAAAAPGVIRSDLTAPLAEARADGAALGDDPLARGETVLVELACDAGLWSANCLAGVAAISRELARRSDLVARVDSLSERPQVVEADGRLALRALVPEVPGDPLALRRLRARASADRASLRGVGAANERAALIQAELVRGAPAREVDELLESLRARFDRPPAVVFASAASAQRALELERAARADLSRVTPLALLGLALLGALAARSVRVGVGVAALAAAALVWCAAGLAFAQVRLGAAAAIVPCLVCAGAAATGFALLHRIAGERRAGREPAGAVARAFGATGTPLAAGALAGGLAFATLGLLARPEARPLALVCACGAVATLVGIGLGVPALTLAFDRGARWRGFPAVALGAILDGWLARLDGALRASGRPRARRIAVSLVLASVAILGMRQLRADASAIRFSPAHTPASDGLELLARDFGGTALLRVVVDSGAAGGAAEPLFLERVQDLERRAAEQPAVGSVRSLLDAVVLPAMRAAHDDDPGFAVVPPTRAQVESAYELLARDAPERLRGGTDATRRWLAIDLVADARDERTVAALRRELEARSEFLFGRSDVLRAVGEDFAAAEESERLARAAPLAACAAIAAIGAIAGLALESTLAGALVALPASLALLFVFGAMGWLGLPLDSVSSALAALVAAAAAGPALLYLSRVRELGKAGAELHVSLSIALRDAGRPIAEGALASLLFLSLLGSALPPVRAFGALACAGVLVSVLAVLTALPICARTLRPRFLIARPAAPAVETHSCVRERPAGREE
jgi:hypothetical protein